MEMHPQQQHSRINLAELKALLVRKLGPVLSEQYFHYLNRFLSLKISKVEFNKVCCRILGRENIPLHNELIRSVLRNACSGKHPPPSPANDALKATASFGSKEISNESYLPNGSHNAIVQALNSQGLSNGDTLPLSPRKARTGFRDRRSGDRRSALGPNGKTTFASQGLGGENSSDINAILENGISIPANVQGVEQHHQRLMPLAEDEREASAHPSVKLSEKRGSLDGPVSVYSRDQIEVSVKQDGKDLHAGSQLQAPLGRPFCSAGVGVAHQAMPSKSKCVSASSSGMLLDNVTLGERMEQIAASQGLEGVSVDCANLLNNGLDAYLKGLISSCAELVVARSGHEPISYKKHLAHSKLVNSVRPGHLYQIQTNSKPLELTPEYRSQSLVSLQNFRVSMELNPHQLGEDWPLLLEKICSRSYEE